MTHKKEDKPKVSLGLYNPLDDDIVRKIYLKKKYVSDGIEEDYKIWSHQKPVLISAQTGSGKNTFIEDKIIPYINERGCEILIISNRIANNRQIKKRIALLCGCEQLLEELSPIGFDKQENFNNVVITTYQKLQTKFDSFNPVECRNFCKNFRIIIFDEAHFFTSDSLFNQYTGSTLYKCILNFRKSIRVYMTATPYEIFPSIVEAEKKVSEGSFSPFSSIHEIIFYDFKRNYKNINVSYFQTKDELIKTINNDNSNNKWIVFTDSIDSGINMCEKLGEKAIFINAGSKSSTGKDNLIYNEMIEKESFSCKVLVSTSVIDNGINIKDPLVKNIVIFTCDQSEFIQMLGRKRRSDDAHINLYICARTSKYFSDKIFQINKKLEAIYLYKRDKKQFLKKYYEGDLENYKIVHNLFSFNMISSLITPQLNILAEKKLYHDRDFYIKIKNQLDLGKKEALIIEFLSWIGFKKTYSEKNWLNYNDLTNAKDIFIKFLRDHVDIPIESNDVENFYSTFKTLYTKAFSKRPNDRADRNYGSTLINKIFKELNWDYKLESKNGRLTLIQI